MRICERTGFEHTQVDLEMSFVSRDDVMATVESMVVMPSRLLRTPKDEKFPVFTYAQAMEQFGR